MGKRIIYVIVFLYSAMLWSQANAEFKMMAQKFRTQKTMLNQEFDKRIATHQDPQIVELLNLQRAMFIKKMDSLENLAYLNVLVKVKNDEDLRKLSKLTVPSDQHETDVEAKDADYPGGINALREFVSYNLYTDAIVDAPNVEVLRTVLTFIVERDGSISSVVPVGDHFSFNRQAMIALYLLPEKFSPAVINGVSVRSHYKLPITIKFQ